MRVLPRNVPPAATLVPANTSVPNPRDVISTILKHDKKLTSYKLALLRSINDVVLSFPDLARDGRDVAVPLRSLAEFWVAYYRPFCDPAGPGQWEVFPKPQPLSSLRDVAAVPGAL